MKPLFIASLLAASIATAAESRVAGPSFGYVFERDAGVVRRIAGIPGASSFDDPIALDGLRIVAVSSPAKYALGISEDGTLVGVRLSTGERFSVDAAGPSPDSAVLSSAGTALMLLWKDSNRLQVISGLPDHPALSFETQIAGSPSLSAVDDDGTHAAFTVRADDMDALYLADSNGASAVQKANHIGAVAFGRSGSLLFADEAALYRVRDGNVQQLTAATDVIALQAAGNGVMAAAKDSILLLNLTDLTSTTAKCGCTISTLSVLSPGVFRVADAVDSPLWILDTHSDEPRFFFVPRAGGSHE